MARVVLDGEVDWPLPKSAGIMMKCWTARKTRSVNQARFLIDVLITFLGFRGFSSPISQILSDIAVDMSGRMAEDALMHANIQNTK